MRVAQWRFRSVIGVIGLAWLGAAAAQTATPATAPPQSPPAAVAQATPPTGVAPPVGGAPGAVCLKCHDDEVGSMLGTRHAVTGDPRSPWGTGKACQACHGESTEHIRNTKVPPTVLFKRSTPAEERNAPCLACHKGGERMHWAASSHARNDVACSDCHNPHKLVDQVRVAQTQAGVCFDCHKDKRAASLRASGHPIRTGAMPCTSCHQPHGSVGEHNLIKTSVNDTCYTCHAEKRGPFLCQQCHEAPFHPSTNYSGNNLPPNLGADKMLGSSCVNCHVKVHGSNHPAGARLTR